MKNGLITSCTKECSNYRFDVRRCGLGKVNPPTIKGGKEAAGIMGLDYICGLTYRGRQVRTQLIDEMDAERNAEGETARDTYRRTLDEMGENINFLKRELGRILG